MKAILEWVKEIIIAVIIACIIMTFVKPIIVRQRSMEPTFCNGDYIFVSRQAYNLFGDPQRGDVIIFHSELKTDDGKDKNLIKRIIGLPGDTVEIVGGYVYLNGEKLDDTYVKVQGISGQMDEIVVPEGELFCLGDNREVSQDSRDAAVGCVDQDEVLGKVFVRIYPFSQFETF